MADSTFNLFGPISKNDVKVGYISTDRGYREGVGVCAANESAKLNIENYNLNSQDLNTVFQAGNEVGLGPTTLSEILIHLQKNKKRFQRSLKN